MPRMKAIKRPDRKSKAKKAKGKIRNKTTDWEKEERQADARSLALISDGLRGE